ncbi:putative chaperone-like ATPase (ISS) [Trypanosoma conorhini]|uniref:Putative chaperone-like ATPase (ISS) n=1 Tax=Trypanosoma conorhini TaxID=83891 RepID=A0A422PNE2_9TRYP|nr:putative chaperone-like ATPase (ISS) [Trypanosoma conorhini]RNF19240.1 putative chaperone-like ATPase (ISS) [Trypanosoma conorhini]
MVVKPAGGSLKRKLKHVTFGPVTILHVPRRRDATLRAPVASPASTDLTLLTSPPCWEKASLSCALEDVNDSLGVGMVTPDSESSLLLTQAASSYPLDEPSDACGVPLEEAKRDDEYDDESSLPAACTHAVASPAQPILSLGGRRHLACDLSPVSPLSCCVPTHKDPEVLGGSPFSLSPEASLLSLKRTERDAEDVMGAARSVRYCVEKDAAPPATCVFCHKSTGVIECHEGHHVHLGCAFWCPEVYYETKEATLKNIGAVLKRCQNIKCVYCRQPGAPIGCVNGRCQRSYHLGCAVVAGAVLNEKTFELRCPKHGEQRSQT